MKMILWVLFVLFAISVGLYPLMYLFIDVDFGLLASKSKELLQNRLWSWAFYLHISFGGIALISGFSQFSEKLRTNNLSLHRVLGKSYLISILFSGIAALGISFYATGGIVSTLGFGSLAVLWLVCSGMAYKAILDRNVELHRERMVRSYSLTFAAVTLRIWLPILTVTFGNFITGYMVVSWLCWVPNLLVSELIIRSKN